jgi:hypothetical protein
LSAQFLSRYTLAREPGFHLILSPEGAFAITRSKTPIQGIDVLEAGVPTIVCA